MLNLERIRKRNDSHPQFLAGCSEPGSAGTANPFIMAHDDPEKLTKVYRMFREILLYIVSLIFILVINIWSFGRGIWLHYLVTLLLCNTLQEEHSLLTGPQIVLSSLSKRIFKSCFG